MELNNLKPASGSTKVKKRLGRGEGSKTGGTAGRGHKGQKSRAGGYHKVGFEGGQMPLQRRLPKRGFVSLAKGQSQEVRTAELNQLPVDEIDALALLQAGLINQHARTVKVILSGEVTRAIKIRGLLVTQGAKAAIEAAGGSIAE